MEIGAQQPRLNEAAAVERDIGSARDRGDEPVVDDRDIAAVLNPGAERAGIASDADELTATRTVDVRDDGSGGAAVNRGSGLVGMTDRVSVLGGRVETSSPPGEGTSIRARIPCE